MAQYRPTDKFFKQTHPNGNGVKYWWFMRCKELLWHTCIQIPHYNAPINILPARRVWTRMWRGGGVGQVEFDSFIFFKSYNCLNPHPRAHHIFQITYRDVKPRKFIFRDPELISLSMSHLSGMTFCLFKSCLCTPLDWYDFLHRPELFYVQRSFAKKYVIFSHVIFTLICRILKGT